MYLDEVESFSDAIKTFNTKRIVENHEWKSPHVYWNGKPNETGHLCGLHAHLQIGGLRSIFERLRSPGGIQLTDSLDKGFTEYAEWMYPGACLLTPVSLHSNLTDPKKIAWWRFAREKMKCGRRPKVHIPKPKEAAWYMKDAPNFSLPSDPHRSADVALMQHIHRIVPAGLPSDMRGDLCQDLLVAVLSGETSVANLPEMMNKFVRDARKMMPDRWKTISLDAITPGTDDHTMMDDLGAGHEHF